METDYHLRNILRGYVNTNRLKLESEVDDLINDLWKLKRKLRNSAKDTHYDVYDYIDEMKHIELRAYDLRVAWDARVRDILKESGHSDFSPEKRPTLDYF